MNTLLTPSPHILIVEDEAIVRLNAVCIFEEAGFTTTEAPDGIAALAKLGQDPKIDVLFTDIDMPGGMNGIELARAVRRLLPSVKVIITSGYSSPTPDDIPPGGRFIAKPYTSIEVTRLAARLAA